MEGAYGEGGEGGRRLSGAALARELEQREVLALLGPSGLPRRDAGPLPTSLALRRRLPLQQVPQRHAPGPPPAARRRRHPPRSVGQIPGSGIIALLSPLPAGAGPGAVGEQSTAHALLCSCSAGIKHPALGGRCCLPLPAWVQLPLCGTRWDGRGGGLASERPVTWGGAVQDAQFQPAPTFLACLPPRVK
jgi:hypothetical protein